MHRSVEKECVIFSPRIPSGMHRSVEKECAIFNPRIPSGMRPEQNI